MDAALEYFTPSAASRAKDKKWDKKKHCVSSATDIDLDHSMGKDEYEWDTRPIEIKLEDNLKSGDKKEEAVEQVNPTAIARPVHDERLLVRMFKTQQKKIKFMQRAHQQKVANKRED